MYKVSVIIPVYNMEKYLPECLDSVLSQSLSDIEVIAIDDASPDNSGVILDVYAERDPRVKVIHLPENHMQGYGRNRGLEKASGKYVYFLDSDDMIVPNALEELYELSEREALDGVFFDSQSLFETAELEKKHGSYLAVRTGTYPEKTVSGSDLLDDFCQQNEWLVYVQREFWRRSYLIDNKIFNIEGIEHEDEFFSFAAALLAERVRYLRKPYFIRRYRENSVMTRRIMPKDFHGYFLSYCKMIELCFSRGIRTYGTDHNIMHMYECMLNNQSVFEDEADPAEWFSADELKSYRLFTSLQSNFEAFRNRERQKWIPLSRYEHIYIYGAGRIANSVSRRIKALGYEISGFIVTSKEGNPDSVSGSPVTELGHICTLPDNSAIIVAMAKSLHAEVEETISCLNCDHFLYANDVFEGPFVAGSCSGGSKEP